MWTGYPPNRLCTEAQTMAQASSRQRKTIGRVMHEFAHGELKSGSGGKGGKVQSRKQAIAIALKEGGASKRESRSENARNFEKSKTKEAHGKTAQQEQEGRSHVGACGRRESSRAMGGKDATHKTARRTKATGARTRRGGGITKAELYRQAKARHIRGRSKMSKLQLENALR